LVVAIFLQLIFDKGPHSKSLKMILFKQSTFEVEEITTANYFDVHTSIFTIKEPLRLSEAKSAPHLAKL
jgi:hypothetical protein